MDDITEITKEQALAVLREAAQNADVEAAHYYADNALCGLLIHLGHKDVVDAWLEVDKWYS